MDRKDFENELRGLIIDQPLAVKRVLLRYGITNDPTPEVLVLAYAKHREAFANDLADAMDTPLGFAGPLNITLDYPGSKSLVRKTSVVGLKDTLFGGLAPSLVTPSTVKTSLATPVAAKPQSIPLESAPFVFSENTGIVPPKMTAMAPVAIVPTGPGTVSSQAEQDAAKKEKVNDLFLKGLQVLETGAKVYATLKNPGSANVETDALNYEVSTSNLAAKEEPRIWGMKKPLFIAVAVIMGLLAMYGIIQYAQRKK